MGEKECQVKNKEKREVKKIFFLEVYRMKSDSIFCVKKQVKLMVYQHAILLFG